MKKNALWIILVLAVIAFVAVYTMKQDDGLVIGNTTIIRPATVANVEADADDLAEEVEDVIQGIIDEVEEEIKEAADTVEDTVEEVVDVVDGEEETVIVENNGYVEYDADAVDLALAADKKVVLFFHAGRCPSCIALDVDVNESLTDIDENTVIVKVDYDTAEELKAQYNVTAQHTLIVLDKEGNAVTTDRGAATLEDVEAL